MLGPAIGLLMESQGVLADSDSVPYVGIHCCLALRIMGLQGCESCELLRRRPAGARTHATSWYFPSETLDLKGPRHRRNHLFSILRLLVRVPLGSRAGKSRLLHLHHTGSNQAIHDCENYLARIKVSFTGRLRGCFGRGWNATTIICAVCASPRGAALL